MATPKLAPALLVQVKSEYGITQIIASVVIPQENGELLNPSWQGRYGSDAFAALDSFQVTAYLGGTITGSERDDRGALWGFDVEYAPHRIASADQARAIATVLTRVEKHMARVNDTDGYVRDGDYHAYIMRVAAALKIRTMYVRNLHGAAVRSGEQFRMVNGASLQSWLDHVTALAREEKYSEILPR